ncbi:MAG TPA: thiamine pyrophosphate-binding protein [Amycolatopsis sp.]|nr:thiamine pyrophosphate-binding protein [Amycolatopsis sp.]
MHDALLEGETTVRDGVVRVLEDAGIGAVFGMPGGHTGVIYDALFDHRDRIRPVLVREESVAGIMAQVYGRLTGRPGVAIGQAAFMLSASAGALEATLSSYPMLLLTDFSVEARFAHAGAYQSGSGEYGSWDARAAFAAFTRRVVVARGGAQTVAATQLAVRHALASGGGCVAMLFPREALRGRIRPGAPALYAHDYDPPALTSPRAEIERAAGLLAGARRPVLIAGNGVHRAHAYDELLALGEELAVPVVTTAGGKSAISERHPLALGVFGTFGTDAANAAVADADVVLSVGSRLAPSDTANMNPDLIASGRQTIIAIDVEPRNLGWTYPLDCALVGDAAAVLRELHDCCATKTHDREPGLARVGEIKQRHPWDDGRSGAPELSATDVISELGELLPDDAIVTADAGENRIFLTKYFRTRRAGSFLQAAGIGTMGYSMPAAMAAKLVHPDRPAVAVCGDGGFAMAMNALLTSIEEQLPIVVVVLDNTSLGWVLHGQGQRPIASEFHDFDYAAIAEAIGCRGTRVRTAAEFRTEFAGALASDRTTVLDVRVSREPSFADVTSPLAGWERVNSGKGRKE